MRLALALITASTFVACDEQGGDEPPIETCGFTCDDGDFCTDDRCDAVTGDCLHVARDASNACTQDRHCDDHDPCTSDSCAVDECGLSRCHHELLLGCRSCASSNTCDDNNPCTNDTCGQDLLCTYKDEPDCQARCRMWGNGNIYRPTEAQTGDISVWGRVEPRGGASCGTACDCSADVTLTDDYASISLTGAEIDGAWSCAITQSCLPPTVVTCDPLQRKREYIVWGVGSADRDAAGAALPFPGDTAASSDAFFPSSPATRMEVESWCIAPTEAGLIGSYHGTLALDGEAEQLFELDFVPGTYVTMHASGEIPEQQYINYEQWTGYSVGFSFTVGIRLLRVDLFPGKDRLVGRVSDPSQPSDAGAKQEFPGDVPSPPQDQFGKRIGKMTLVLVR